MGQGVSSEASKALAAVWILLALTFLLSLLRLYIRICVTPSTRWGNDDYYYFASFIFFFIYGVLIQAASEFGLGQDASEIDSQEDVSRGVLCELIGQTFLIAANITSKLSVGYFLLLLDQDKKFRKPILAPVITFGVAVTVTTLVSWFPCQPIAYLWDRTLNGRCDINPIPAAVIAGVMSVIVDLWYAAFPWYMLVWDGKKFKQRNLIAERKRIGISVWLSLGVLAAGLGVKRATELGRLRPENYLEDTAELVIWHVAELGVTLIATAVPVCFIPLFKDEMGWFLDKCCSLCCTNLWHRSKSHGNEIRKSGILPVGRAPYISNPQAIPSDAKLNENGATIEAHSPRVYGDGGGEQMVAEFQQGHTRRETVASVESITEYGAFGQNEKEIRLGTPKSSREKLLPKSPEI